MVSLCRGISNFFIAFPTISSFTPLEYTLAVSQVERPIVHSITDLQYIPTSPTYLCPRPLSISPILRLPPSPNSAKPYCQYPWYQGLAWRLEARRSPAGHNRLWWYSRCFAVRQGRVAQAFC